MAIQFNPNALSMFSSVNFGNDNAIANLGGDNGLVQKDELGSFLWKPFRSGNTEKQNTAVRTELLKALGDERVWPHWWYAKISLAELIS